MTRRNFIEGGGRIFFLAVMLLGLGFLVIKRRISLEGYCEDNDRCKACRLSSICREPLNQTSVKNGKQST